LAAFDLPSDGEKPFDLNLVLSLVPTQFFLSFFLVLSRLVEALLLDKSWGCLPNSLCHCKGFINKGFNIVL
jgi:hypothetical protein